MVHASLVPDLFEQGQQAGRKARQVGGVQVAWLRHAIGGVGRDGVALHQRARLGAGTVVVQS